MTKNEIPDFMEKDIRRFWKFVEKSDGCWRWRGTLRSNGYGRFALYYRAYAAHRCMWKLTYGEPGELYVLHRCDNPICVRPDHLFLGTLSDNTRDAISKGRLKPRENFHNKERRAAPGEQHHCAKLTERQVLEARRRHAAGESAERMCGEFGVNWRTLHDAIKGITWKHI